MSDRVKEDVCVILIASSAFSRDELRGFFEMLSVCPEPAVRCLVKINSLDEAESFAAVLSPGGLAVEIQILSHVDLGACPLPGATVFSMPPASTSADADSLAVALSDVVLVGSLGRQPGLQQQAVEHGKKEVPIGPRPGLSKQEHVDDLMKIDPRSHRVRFDRFWGKGELFLVALLTFLPSIAQSLYVMGIALLASPERLSEAAAEAGTVMQIRRRLLRRAFATLGLPFRRLYDAVFGRRDLEPDLSPSGWRDICPDHRLRSRADRTTMMAWFIKFDRAGSSGARRYRDLIWLAHVFAAAAVFSAVAGARWPEEALWPMLEIGLLLAIALIVVKGRDLYRRWMACRLGAEDLRASILCVSLFATPGLLNKSYGAAPDKQASRFAASTAHAVAVRAVRDHGLSNLHRDFGWQQAAKWVVSIAEGQLGYHRSNHRKLEDLERAIKFFNTVLFVIILFVVAMHLLAIVGLVHFHLEWALFVTAGGPATVGALHSAAIQLNLVHRSRASEGCAQELAKAIGDFEDSLKAAGSEAVKWSAVRRLAVQTADIMTKEVETWHANLARQPIALP